MEYLIIFILQILGIGLHVAQKVLEIDARDPDDTLAHVCMVFIKENRVSLFISALVLVLNLVAHYIIGTYSNWPEQVGHYELWSFCFALVLGYAGQRLVYKLLGHAENTINKKIGL